MTADATTQVRRAPAPWRLRGQGYIFALRVPHQVLARSHFLPADLAASRRGRLAWAMFVDYETSDVGPYRELLFIPGSVRFSEGRRRTISRIYVSTEASVVNARANWGIPKEQGDFELRYGADGIDEVSLSREGRPIAALRMCHRGWRLPFNGGWMPRRLRMLGQRLDAKEYTYAPAARGHVEPAQLLEARIDGGCFPELAPEHVLFAVKATDFEMTFPAAQVRALA